jgi:hypothetical protein
MTEQNHALASFRPSPEDELAEILVEREEDASFIERTLKHPIIRSSRLVLPNPNGVVPCLA